MKTKIMLSILLGVAITLCLTYSYSQAENLKIAIMQDQEGSAKKYAPLVSYFETRGIKVSFINTQSYSEAALMFAQAKADAMFSGSGIAGTMIMKRVAKPIVRPLSKEGTSTYWTVILAQKGSAKYTESADYFSGKKVSFCSLASSGEFYLHAIGGHKTASELIQANSHESAIDLLANGTTDIAIVKNRVWDRVKNKYPDIEVVGSDTGENPDGTLIVSKIVSPKLSEKVTSILLGLMEDSSPEARMVKDQMNILGFIQITMDNFRYTLALLREAGVSRSFNFTY